MPRLNLKQNMNSSCISASDISFVDHSQPGKLETLFWFLSNNLTSWRRQITSRYNTQEYLQTPKFNTFLSVQAVTCLSNKGRRESRLLLKILKLYFFLEEKGSEL